MMDRTRETDALDHALTALYQQPEAPEGYAEAWRGAIRREEQLQMKTKLTPKRFWRLALPVAAALVLVIGAVYTGATQPGKAPIPTPSAVSRTAVSTANDMVATETADYAMDSGAGEALYASKDSASSTSGAGAAAVLPAGSKLVRTADVTLSTRQFDIDQQQLVDRVAALGGYVESSYVSGDAEAGRLRRGSYSVRIPADKLDEFLTFAAGLARVTSRSEYATDMTAQYSDTDTRLRTQQTKMERLLTLMSQATVMSDIIELESAIADTQYLLDCYQTELNRIDDQVALSQVSLTLNEESGAATAQAEDVSLWERIRSGFAASLEGLGLFLQNMLVFVVSASPALAVLCALGVVIWLIRRAKRRKHPDEPAEK